MPQGTEKIIEGGYSFGSAYFACQYKEDWVREKHDNAVMKFDGRCLIYISEKHGPLGLDYRKLSDEERKMLGFDPTIPTK